MASDDSIWPDVVQLTRHPDEPQKQSTLHPEQPPRFIFDRETIQRLFDDFGGEVRRLLDSAGIPASSSLIFHPWHATIIFDPEKTVVFFEPRESGHARVDVYEWERVSPIEHLFREAGRNLTPGHVVVELPRPDVPRRVRDEMIFGAAERHTASIEIKRRRIASGGVPSDLAPALRLFLKDHPTYDKNVFIMMRFIESEEMKEIHAAIKASLADHGFAGLRADDRDYTGELWSNIQVHMIGSRFGIAVFEQIETRDFNPNVSLELGYMLGMQKRCLILKERRLPNLPADIVHRLYKSFDMFRIQESITNQVSRWVTVDLTGLL